MLTTIKPELLQQVNQLEQVPFLTELRLKKLNMRDSYHKELIKSCWKWTDYLHRVTKKKELDKLICKEVTHKIYNATLIAY